jgi:hypothetical protein
MFYSSILSDVQFLLCKEPTDSLTADIRFFLYDHDKIFFSHGE